MEVKYSGLNVSEYVKDYVVLDLETTSYMVKFAEIIEIGAIRVRDDKVVDEYQTFVKPNGGIPKSATDINGITNKMVKDAPTFSEVVDELLAFIGSDVIVGYNIRAYDINLLFRYVYECRKKELKNNVSDVLHMARRCLKDIPSYTLESVSNYYCVENSGAHRALKDCYITMSCYQRLYQEYGASVFARSRSSSFKKAPYSESTKALRNLKDIVDLVVCKQKVNARDIYLLKAWLDEHSDLEGQYPFDNVLDGINTVLAQGETPQTFEPLREILADCLDPVKGASKDLIEEFKDKHFCITGDFQLGNRNVILDLIAEKGGKNSERVTNATDYLIVGALGSPNWSMGNYGTKVKSALEKMTKGSSIRIVDEETFQRSLKELNKETSSSEEGGIGVDEESEKNWQNAILEIFGELIQKYNLPEGCLEIKKNKSKDESKITSYSLLISERDYPEVPNMDTATKSVLVNINPRPIKDDYSTVEVKVPITLLGKVHLPENISPKQRASEKDFFRLRIDKNSIEFLSFIQECTRYCIENYHSTAPVFGCCSKYIECSNQRKCIHVNQLYSTACLYRKNLEANRIFYGINKNI